MKKYFFIIPLIAIMFLSNGYVQAAGSCCKEKACVCAKGECCKDGKCTCKGSCCKDGKCTCKGGSCAKGSAACVKNITEKKSDSKK